MKTFKQKLTTLNNCLEYAFKGKALHIFIECLAIAFLIYGVTEFIQILDIPNILMILMCSIYTTGFLFLLMDDVQVVIYRFQFLQNHESLDKFLRRIEEENLQSEYNRFRNNNNINLE